MDYPANYTDVNSILEILLKNVHAILGSHMIGMYLDGSLASDDFDQDSDIDFVVVTDEEISEEQFTALQAMHGRLAKIDSVWAIQLEGFYLSQQALRRHRPGGEWVPNIERGQGERLKRVLLDPVWDVHRSILRKQGITLAGPPPQSLIDPVSPAQLQQAMRLRLPEWAAYFQSKPGELLNRGNQSYIVLSICRILYTIRHGEVVSKRVAADWAQESLGEPWARLIERAWDGRHHPDQRSSPQEVEKTLEFLRYSLENFAR